MALYAAGSCLLFFYVAVVFNPEETADNLKRQNGFIPASSGKNTAAYLDHVLTRITVIGAAYLAAICLIPDISSPGRASVPARRTSADHRQT